VSGASDPIEIRSARADDRSAILRLLASSLNWVPNELFDRFFAWKHEANPFGTSPAWVAIAGDRLVGFRTFVCWEFDHPDGRVRTAVRAVDTATDPDFRGMRIFQRLTLHSIEELRRTATDFVFNTPNDKSRPGYLKMGWRDVGRLPAAARPSSPFALARMLRSRVPADRWSRPSTAGVPAVDLLNSCDIERLLSSIPSAAGLRTRRTAEYLRWRYGFAPLAYRAVALEDDPMKGVAVFRVRTRGIASEAALCEVLVPRGNEHAARALERTVARTSNADYVIRLGAPSLASGYAPVPGMGPKLTWRGIADGAVAPGLAAWQLQLGDIELF
jgi:GNAT superfamily N-acetyltransferase